MVFANFHHTYPGLNPLDLTLAVFMMYIEASDNLKATTSEPTGEYYWMEQSSRQHESLISIEMNVPDPQPQEAADWFG